MKIDLPIHYWLTYDTKASYTRMVVTNVFIDIEFASSTSNQSVYVYLEKRLKNERSKQE